jgi:thymidylate synthase ThyX
MPMFLNWNFYLSSPPSAIMERTDAIKQIQEACKQIALQFMKIHPAVRHLNDAETQAESLKSMHEMTVHLESIKKRLIRLEKRDDSAEL